MKRMRPFAITASALPVAIPTAGFFQAVCMASDITITEGRLEVSEFLGQKIVMIGTGRGVALSPAGAPDKVRQTDSATMPRWREEQP